MASKRQRLLKKWEAREAREVKKQETRNPAERATVYTRKGYKPRTTARHTPKGYKRLNISGALNDLEKVAKKLNFNSYNDKEHNYDNDIGEYNEVIDVLKEYGINYNKFTPEQLKDIGTELDIVHETFSTLEKMTNSARAGAYATQTLANLQDVPNPNLWLDTLIVVVNAGLVEFGNSSYL